ncbi:MAG: RNA-binding protein [Geobacteraceae bacterium GWC2_58_44]|nr:MAG: RNA-binding protein [Geobacteraceae bacterium GWC2_58_44]HBG05386.1 RNA-binding protein [Geobacter sp.]
MAKGGKELYVGSLSYDATEYDIEKLFSVSGRVTSVHLIVDLKTGQFKGCGYVRMSTEAEARDAVNSLDGAMLIDRQITVSIANPQKMKAKGGGAPFRGRPKSGGSDNNPDEAKPAASKPAASKPAAARPAAAKPGFAKASESPRAGFSKPESPRAGYSKPDSARTGFSKPGAPKTGSSRPGAPRAGSSRPSSSKSGTTRSKK